VFEQEIFSLVEERILCVVVLHNLSLMAGEGVLETSLNGELDLLIDQAEYDLAISFTLKLTFCREWAKYFKCIFGYFPLESQIVLYSPQ